MHGRQSKQVRSLLRSRAGSSRSLASAAALKPAPPTLGKWERPQATANSSTSPAKSKSKWVRPSEPEFAHSPSGFQGQQQRFGEPHRPNVNRWARQIPVEPSRSAVLGDLDASRAPSSTSRNYDLRNRPQNQPRNGGSWHHRAPQSRADSTTKKSPWMEKLSSKTGIQLDRDSAPHLSAGGTTLPNLREQSASMGARERNLRADHTFEAYKNPRIRDRPVRAVGGDIDYYRPTDRFESTDEGERNKRGQRDSFKSRGSVVERLRMGGAVEIPKHSRMHEDRMEAVRKAKKKLRVIRSVSLDVAIPSIVSVGNLARLLGVRLETLQNCMLRNDMESQSSYDHMLSADDASLLAMEFNRNPLVDDEAAFDIYASPPHPDYASLPRRPPVVTIMGHVDHGKTTLLDTLRSSAVAKGEAGGITQHIGAFSVPVPGASASSDIPDTITFLDTPGHAAFSAMRARGAQVTDIIVLVVAADDGVMPQTKEIINLIKNDRGKAGVVVAINKVDKQGADIDKVMTALWAEGIELEVMGGDIPSVEVSGLTGHGLDTLIETISLVAEMQDIRAEADGPAHGYVLESKVQKGLGNTATVLLLRGKLTPSSHIISGTTFAKIRQLMDSQGETVKSSIPGSAVIVTGWKMLPSAGDEVLQGKENDVKRAVENRLRQASLEATLGDAEAINASRRQEREEREQRAQNTLEEAAHAPVMKAVGPKELRLIIKGDVSGSVEALAAAVEGIGNKDAITKVVSTGVGEVSESDVMLARAAEGMIVAFSVNVSRIADQAAVQNGIPVFSSKIIYSVLDEVKARIIKLLPPIIEKRVTGEANVLQLFDINGKGRSIIKVAGCRVSNGIVEKDKHVRVLRNGETIHEGTLGTLRILKRDVTEVKKGLECGMNLSGFDDLRNGDLIQFFQRLEKPGQL